MQVNDQEEHTMSLKSGLLVRPSLSLSEYGIEQRKTQRRTRKAFKTGKDQNRTFIHFNRGK